MKNIPFKLFGLQRTGTNLSRLLLLQNFEITSLEIGHEWKHGPISPEHRNWIHDGQPVRLVVCVKNPYAWLVSCYNHFTAYRGIERTIDPNFEQTWDFEKFVKSPSYNFKDPVHRWNTLIRHWLQFPKNREFTEIILHESMLDERGQQRVMERIGKNQNLTKKSEIIYGVSRRVGMGMTLNECFDGKYYQEMQYLAQYSDSLLDYVNRSVDLDLLKILKYKKISGQSSKPSRRAALLLRKSRS